MSDLYYQMNRPDVAKLIPNTCKRILEVGCGYGGLGRLLKVRGNVQMHGVEINLDADKHLQGIYDSYVIGNIETIDIVFPPEYFDCIVLADVLEHLIDPWSVLRNLTSYLKTDGYVIASIPNIRNLALLYNLLVRGTWKYTDSGLLDRTHLRFFTRKEISHLFDQAGLEIEVIDSKTDGYSFLREIMIFVPVLLIPDLKVSQFLISAKKITNSNARFANKK